ncbi:hypothetical protein NHQ30_002793 [Ciborinia camelliae]|nr:hypothetical protein NHQ30_002793 [Ciborinia camelliae]
MPLERFVQGMKYWCLLEVVYPPTVAVVKSSIAFYLIRIANKPIHIYTIYVSMAIFLAYTAAFFFFLLLQCRPITFFWTRLQGETNGHCAKAEVIAGLAYGHGAVSVMTDLTLGIIPAFIVVDLQINTRTKVAVAMTLALGSIASVCTITRLAYIQTLLTDNDYLYSISTIITLSIVESAVAITASCLATLKPLVRSFLDWTEKSIGGSGTLHTRIIDNMSRKRTRVDDTELNLRPDLKIVGFTTTVISSNGRDSSPSGHGSLDQTLDAKTYALYTPHGSPMSGRLGSESGLMQAAEPAYHIK